MQRSLEIMERLRDTAESEWFDDENGFGLPVEVLAGTRTSVLCARDPDDEDEDEDSDYLYDDEDDLDDDFDDDLDELDDDEESLDEDEEEL